MAFSAKMSAPIYGSIITGFERIGKKEIEDRLKVPCETARGNVRFSLEVQRIPEVKKLQTRVKQLTGLHFEVY